MKGHCPLPQSAVGGETLSFEGLPSGVIKFYKIVGKWQEALMTKGIKLADVSGFIFV